MSEEGFLGPFRAAQVVFEDQKGKERGHFGLSEWKKEG